MIQQKTQRMVGDGAAVHHSLTVVLSRLLEPIKMEEAIDRRKETGLSHQIRGTRRRSNILRSAPHRREG
jgi:hypothetical protein